MFLLVCYICGRNCFASSWTSYEKLLIVPYKLYTLFPISIHQMLALRLRPLLLQLLLQDLPVLSQLQLLLGFVLKTQRKHSPISYHFILYICIYT